MPFRAITGPRRLFALLSRSLSRGSLPPSLVFAGPGAEKRATALATAQALNCLRPETFDTGDGSHLDACGACLACTRIARGVHPDVVIVEPGDSGSIKVEQVREVIEQAAFRPFEGKRRVVIIDQADLMVVSAQNALLKILEEPPPSSVFVLVTARPDMLLDTVRSRCIRLWFADVTAPVIDSQAIDVAERVLMHAASGSDPRLRIECAQTLLAKTGEASASDRAVMAAHLQAMASLLRDAGLVSTGADETLFVPADFRSRIDRLAKVYAGERVVRAFAAVDRALTAVERQNAGVKLVADWVVLQL